ncbi:fumarylacetoacetate hydrolase family protein [Rhodococcus sp. BP-349]|uniref:2-keto-4-pentenoate hydratase n=1 Tax=unclassified Rhodococcus (in: high G+C Gram-positive bacteria) TaxID=192944 RepID=UPI001C9B4F7C|nr:MULTISPECIES: fumarylacetoacetate hydrolase family protein [unclassified Rhodococcus (in: high G+C Gram-positive bacteria)]MBY6540384.1 fumarylacetoacetate hydrolase family protein [Rhodococcus sp. BP-363]MBY6545591.1 fumarylacetoacetate hydrolase family protein [Rhodococcus sp. BP-369]MBY6564821.1 fumarylacetoacetate hydrolase family protein [Rhodococcus sp. BP-370]MBY6578243.1 fumarylacetoacetate hydrolase family protein [Rhodococcus sp. BP-364]MBY6587544.1 fumarylacetoacetate hydrolase f
MTSVPPVTPVPNPVAVAADRLAEASTSKTPCAPVRDLVAGDDVDTAYLIASRNVQARIASGRRIVGRKIGLTSPAVQKQLGVDRPDFGVLFDDFDVSADEHIDSTRLLQPRIEAEIAFILSSPIDREITVDDAPGYVETVAAAFEIVDSRIAGWDITLADTVADNASSGLYVLGDTVTRTAAPELADVGMTMTADGDQVSSGRGSDCLGSPWNALVWLANTSLAYGSPLQAGEVILSGALGPMVPVTPGSTYEASISGVGTVTATFTA